MIHEMPSPFAEGEDLEPEVFPELNTISAAFFYQYLPIPTAPLSPPEYVYVPIASNKKGLKLQGMLATWNSAWEAGPLRHNLFDTSELPGALRHVQRHPECDFQFVPLEGDTRYPGYAPLYHLLPLATLRRFDLPALKRTTWPSFHDWRLRRGRELPWDFESRFGAAFAHHVWPLLNPGVPAWSLSNREPIRLLAHNLDFWVPYIDLVARERRSTDERCRPEDEEQTARLQRLQAQAPAEYRVHRPLMGGWVWMGEEEAWEATGRLVDVADQHGGLRGLIEAVRRHRIEDDFSDRWSWAKEDFERKVYRKRSRIKTVFVELGDTIPVIGPESEVHEDLLWEDFLALLDRKGRRIVVCLRSGATRATDIAKELGYANHSPVSKALARIRQKALRYLSE